MRRGKDSFRRGTRKPYDGLTGVMLIVGTRALKTPTDLVACLPRLLPSRLQPVDEAHYGFHMKEKIRESLPGRSCCGSITVSEERINLRSPGRCLANTQFRILAEVFVPLSVIEDRSPLR